MVSFVTFLTVSYSSFKENTNFGTLNCTNKSKYTHQNVSVRIKHSLSLSDEISKTP